MMKAGKIVSVLGLALLLSVTAIAQQRPVLSQYMFSGLVLNPAYAGRHDYTSFTAMYRDQWLNVPGAPKLTTFTTQTGIKDKKIGLGLMITDDKIGVHENLSVYGSYAYYIRLRNKAKLSMGLQGGFDMLRSNWDLLYLYDLGDPSLSGSIINYFPNFGAGLYYFTETFYLGFSAPYLLTSTLLQTDNLYEDVRHSRNYYITTGKIFDLSEKLKIKPSFLIRLEDNMPLAVDLNANFYYDELIDVGFSYRQGDSMIGILGLQVNKYLKFSYAYDYIISELSAYSKGSHELMLQYRINFNAPRHNRMCPQPQYF
jgi:type IX secretion system PorP/SprF family membrane protein